VFEILITHLDHRSDALIPGPEGPANNAAEDLIAPFGCHPDRFAVPGVMEQKPASGFAQRTVR
jgi:hypothetical protein